MAKCKEFKIDSFEFTEFDTFLATVIQRSSKGCKIVALTDEGYEIPGFTPFDSFPGSKLLVSPIFQFGDDGSFYFRCEGVISEAQPFEAIISSAAYYTSATTTSIPKNGNVA